MNLNKELRKGMKPTQRSIKNMLEITIKRTRGLSDAQ